ncbi:hamartin-like isoform X2 [Scleropages formosus]|uniref:hamartin-like isoform X2 n=1 Tax=Scleropages formosus TaxID=113540 RepID=UPI0010FA99BF|nr:hamartin-like isoform X2 [Scleropages formosus]
MAREQPHAADLLPLLDSSDLRQVEEVKGLIREHLNTERGAVLVNSLVDYYLETSSSEAVHILSSVREPHDKHLLDKMNECMANKACRLHTLTLLGHVVRKQPSWIHKITRFPLLLSLLKCLKTDTDVVVLITGVLVLIILLPMIPQPGKQHLYEFFDIFGRLAAWNLKNPGRVTEVYLIHLHASVYSLFHRLYGMYPCNFVSYLRSHYSMKENMDTFEEVVKPMLEHVRIHPELVTGTKDHELDPTRWRRYEVHDIVIECAKVSLDPKEASCEEGYSTVPEHFSIHQQLRLLDCAASPYTDFHSSCGSSSSNLFSPPRQALVLSLSGTQAPYRSPKSSRHQNQSCELNNSCGQKDSIWSPSSVCGMATPPPSRSISPTSVAELSHSASHILGRGHGTMAGGKGTPSFSTPVAASPPPDGFANTSLPQDTSSPPLKDSRPLEPMRPSLVRQEPVREPEKTSIEAADYQEGGNKNVPMTLTELSSFIKQQGAEKEHEDDYIAEELLKITEDKSEHSTSWSLDSPFCHTTETLTGNQGTMLAASAPNQGPDSRGNSMSTVDRYERQPCVEGLGLQQPVQDPWAFQSMFTPIDNPTPDHPHSSSMPEEGGVTSAKCGLFSPSPHGELSLPYEPLFDLALPKAAPLFVGRRTSEALQRASGEQLEEGQRAEEEGVSLGITAPTSPLEVLDRLIQQGNDTHDKVLKRKDRSPFVTPVTNDPDPSLLLQARLPLPSKSADWTHFGGSAPMDELHTLRSQLLLLHNQLLYERYKREQHAVRNRRLLRRIINSTALEEQNNAMKDQLNLQNMDIFSLKESLQVEQQRYRQLWEDRETVVTRLHSQIRQLQQGRDEYYTKNQELQSKLFECQKKISELEAELQKANNKVCNTGHQLNQLSVKLTSSENIQQQMAFLNKQLLLLGEVNKLCVEELRHSTSDTTKESYMLQASSEKELERLRQALVVQGQRLEAAQQRVAELEVQLAKKEHLVVEQKKFLEDVKAQARGELKASESRYQAQRQVTQALQSELLQLYSRLEIEKPTAGDGPLQVGSATEPCGSADSRQDSSSTTAVGAKVKTATQDGMSGSPAASQSGNSSTLSGKGPLPSSSVNGNRKYPTFLLEPSLTPVSTDTTPLTVGSYPSSNSFLGMRSRELFRNKSESQCDNDARHLASLTQGLKTELCTESLGRSNPTPSAMSIPAPNTAPGLFPARATAPKEAQSDVQQRANNWETPASRASSVHQRQQELRIMDYDETHHEHS